LALCDPFVWKSAPIAIEHGAADRVCRGDSWRTFPASVEEITLKAGEQRTAALLSGKASASDIAAGVALGRGSLPCSRRAPRPTEW
jgi:hypothetical protein